MDVDVQIRFEGGLAWYHHLPSVRMVVREGTSLGDLLFLLGVDPGDGIVVINGHPAAAGTVLAGGDDIVIRRRDDT